MDPVSLNANHALGLHLGIPPPPIRWRDGREALPTRDLHRRRTKQRHQENPGYHKAALGGLERGRKRRAWSNEAILGAIHRFRREHGRWPIQKDFRSTHGLPGYATVWRRFGSVSAA
ncbi:MAG: homing endonuclease associated repeat-containing protein, partial [Actinomycetota bacterium]